MTAARGDSFGTETDLPQLTRRRAVWWIWLVRAGSAALLILVAIKFARTNPADLRAALPDSLWFWPTLLVLYFSLPTADWLIFRRIWRLPSSALPILVGKRISNELLLMYSGELYFYLWAQRHANLTNAPFATIRDVNIVSALVGNGLTVVLAVLAAPFLSHLDLAGQTPALIASAAVIAAAPVSVFLFSRRAFVLSRADFAWIAGVHLCRLVLSAVLMAALWRMSLPEAPLTLWIALATVRLFISRLPLALNSEVLFAAFAGVLVGGANEVTAVVSMTSMAILALHLLCAGVLLLGSLFAGRRR